jgi:hypothetical protein
MEYLPEASFARNRPSYSRTQHIVVIRFIKGALGAVYNFTPHHYGKAHRRTE